MLTSKRAGVGLALAGLVGPGIAVMPAPAQAWWRGGWCGGVRFGVFLPPLVVTPPIYAPPPVYYAPPAAYYLPQRPWIPPHWQGGYWVPGHWG
jgi:hypothetical protein